MATSPPLSKRRLSRILRERREASGLTADQVVERARELGVPAKLSPSTITRMERNEWLRPKFEVVEALLRVYDIGSPERDEIMQLVREARQRGWWASYTDVLGKGTLTGLLPGASRVREVTIGVLPGLLQTEGYARAVILGGGITDAAEIDRRIEARMLRQQVLTAEEAPTYWAIIDEAALRKIPSDLREAQVSQLIDVQRPNLRVQVLPDAAGLHAAVAGGFTLLDFDGDPGLAYSENAVRQWVTDDAGEIAVYDLVYQYVSASALGVQESTSFLERLIT
ncbi:helix-turn-helix transcriptional regulator [Nocardiopsis sp. FIRDI 009]|uniref:helix-turn-helix domain-containing protein n=1 Tax=Nocardiopsis sp. FIRDI 009 TaxID=714197 RepID=UPI000E22330F|nr:helix-turn-helix transcriptional regulator [Nocardiopsis sp. FIRDI 009]